MKRVLALVGVLLMMNAVQCDEMAFWNEMVECAQGMGISPDEMTAMMAAKDEKAGCIQACVMEKIGSMVDEKLTMENLMNSLEKNKATVKDYDKTKAGIQACFEQVTSGGDLPKCESAGKFALCMQEHMQ